MSFTPLNFRVPDELAPWRSLAPIRLLPRAVLHYTIHLSGCPYIVKYGALYDSDCNYIAVLHQEFVEDTDCYKILSPDGYLYYKKDGSFFGRKHGELFVKNTIVLKHVLNDFNDV